MERRQLDHLPTNKNRHDEVGRPPPHHLCWSGDLVCVHQACQRHPVPHQSGNSFPVLLFYGEGYPAHLHIPRSQHRVYLVTTRLSATPKARGAPRNGRLLHQCTGYKERESIGFGVCTDRVWVLTLSPPGSEPGQAIELLWASPRQGTNKKLPQKWLWVLTPIHNL